VITRVLLALLLVMGGSGGAVAMTRDEAITDLARPDDTAARRRAVTWLGEHGTMTDLPRLATALHDADAGVRALADTAMWQVWSRSGDEETDRLFAIGVAQMSEGNGAAAVATFTAIIARRPDFAEGWNKRATVYYLLGEYDKSLADCAEVMKRNPYHYGALSGYGMIYLQLRQPEQALAWFEKALAVNPNLDGVRESVEGLRQLLIEKRKNAI
jgi:tetratricopeptide (TPR) repeat protein